MTVTSTSGSVRHIRPLPSDSTTTTVPVSATREVGARDARPRRAGTSRAGAAARPRRARAGSSVRPSGAGRPTSPISSRKMSRISRRLRWIAGTRMCDGQVVAELDDQLGEVGLPGVDALLRASASLSSISWVAIDLTLTTSVAPCVAGDAGHDRVGLGRVAGPVDDAAGRGHGRLELLEQLRQVAQDVVLDRGAGEPQLLPVGALGDGARPASSGSSWWRGRGCRAAACRRARRGRPPGTAACRRTSACAARRPSPRARSTAPSSSVPARISARCMTRTPRPLARQQAADVHQAGRVGGGQHLGAGAEHVGDLVGAHRDRGVRVLDRERAAEAAALVGVRRGRPGVRPSTAASSRCGRSPMPSSRGEWQVGWSVTRVRERARRRRSRRARRPGTRTARRPAARPRRPAAASAGRRPPTASSRRPGGGGGPSRRTTPTA